MIRKEEQNNERGCKYLFLQFRRDAEQYNADMLIVMLGINDLLESAKAGEVARRMEVLLTGCDLPNTLLVSPPPMKRGAWVPDDGLVEAFRELSGQYKALAERLGMRYADSGEWHIDLTFDGVHFTEEGHMHFAEGLASCLGRIYT